MGSCITKAKCFRPTNNTNTSRNTVVSDVNSQQDNISKIRRQQQSNED